MQAVKRALGFAMRAPLFSSGILAFTGPSRYLVLTYHRVNDDGHPFFGGIPVELFRRQMDVVRRHFAVHSLTELAERADRRELPDNAIAITFDDGYRDNFENAFPILREMGLPATIFLVPDAIDHDPLIWHDRVFDAFHRTAKSSLDFEGRSLSLATTAAREKTLRVVLSELRSSAPETRDRLIDGLLHALAIVPDPAGFQKLSWDDVRTMAGAGVSFGAHTLDHPILSRVEPDEARRQIRESKRRIESELDSEVTAFAYPNGNDADFTERTEELVEEEGFTLAVTTIPGANDRTTDPFRLHRVGMWGDDPGLSLLRLALTRRSFSD